MQIKTATVNPYAKQSLVNGHQSNGISIPAPIPQHAATASILKTALPTMVPVDCGAINSITILALPIMLSNMLILEQKCKIIVIIGNAKYPALKLLLFDSSLQH